MGRNRLVRFVGLIFLALFFLVAPLLAFADVATRLPGQKYNALGNSRGRAMLINALSCSYLQTAGDGTPSCTSPPAPPEYVSRVQVAGATVQAYGVVKADGATDDQVVEADTAATSIVGVSQSGASVTSTNPLEVATDGVMRAATDTGVAVGDQLYLGASGKFYKATGNQMVWGEARTSGSGGSAYVMRYPETSGYIRHPINLWPDAPDMTTKMEVVEFNPDMDLSGIAVWHSVFHINPSLHIGQASSLLGAISGVSSEGMTILHDDATTSAGNLPGLQLFWANHIMTTSVAVAAPVDYVLLDNTMKRGSGAITVPSGGTHHTVASWPIIKSIAGATTTIAAVNGLDFAVATGTDNASSDGAALTVSELNAVKANDATKDSGTGTTTLPSLNGLNCGNLTAATTNSCVRSAVTADASRYFLNDTGGAQSSLVGKFTKYNNITTAGTGLPIIAGESGVSATKTADFTSLSYTPPATAGRYRVEQVITTTSGTNTGQFQCTVDYVDSQGTTHTADLMPMVNQTGLWATAIPVVAGASKEWHCGPTYITINNAATAIVLKVDVTTGSVNYTVAASVEQIG